ncbi:MAG: hypothetical protein NTW08_05500 [Gammaproteobacteria bacterium]|nr:hypothetical protein [Gammaproteobacteria bacterium]
MIKRIFTSVSVALFLFFSQSALANTGQFFEVIASGTPGLFNIVLCLDATAPTTCQSHTVLAQNLSIRTLVPNHLYPAAGLKVLTTGFSPSGSCQLNNSGFCVFSVSSDSSVSIVLTNSSVTLSSTPSSNTRIGLAYSQTNIASGGAEPYGYSVSAGSLPTGTSLNTSTGTVSGTPTTAGSFSYIILTTDTGGATATALTSGTITATVGGTVSGLSGSGLVLQNNGGDNLSVTTNGGFTFNTPLTSGSTYNVTVLTDPSSPSQTCVVSNGASTVTTSNITNVVVTCTTNAYTVGGTVSGLNGSGLVLQNNAGDNLSVTTNGGFTFNTPLTSGSTYNVTVLTDPSSLSQTCVVSNGASTVTTSNITNVVVTCTTNAYTVGGNVSGLTGSGLVLQNNATDNLSVSENGAFTFATSITSGQVYSVTIQTQPTRQECSVTNGSGTMGAAPVTNVTITCVNTGPWGNPVRIDTNGSTHAISCSSASVCMVVDNAGYATQYTDGSWASPTLIDPGNLLVSVSCPLSSFCMAVDLTNPGGLGGALIYNAPSWGARIPVITTESTGRFSSVSCPTSTFCMAVDDQGHFYKYDGSTWVLFQSVSSSYILTSVSCPNDSFCMAVDGSGQAYIYNGSIWTALGTVDPHFHLTSVSCLNSGFCMAVDQEGYALTYFAGTWHTPVNIDASHALTSVSCPNALFCMAVDDQGNVFKYTGTTWGAPESIDTRPLTSISCPNVTFCMAIDNEGYAINYVNPILSTIYIGTSAGNVDISNNNGLTWTQTAAQPAVRAAVTGISLNVAGTLYAGSVSSTDTVATTTNNGDFWITTSSLSGGILSLFIATDGTLYSSAGAQVLVSTNNGSSWNPTPAAPDGSTVYSVFVSQSGRLYAGTENGNVAVSNNSGNTWTTTTQPDPGAGARISSVFVTSNGTLYAGSSDGNLKISMDAGASWTSTTQSDSCNISGLSVTSSGVIYEGTSCGSVEISIDGGNTWTATTGIPGADAVFSLFVHQP